MAKEFYPKETWNEFENLLHEEFALADGPFDGDLSGDPLDALVAETNRTLLKASATTQADNQWISVRESVSQQHRVEVKLTPAAMTRPISFTVDMSSQETGCESKLIGKSVQSVPFKLSFIVKKVTNKHPLYNFSGKQLTANLAIDKVLKPPFKLPSLEPCSNSEELRIQLLTCCRSVPFKLAEELGQVVAKANPEHPKAKATLRCIVDFLTDYGRIPQNFKKNVLVKISEMGTRYDPEMELSYLDAIYDNFLEGRSRFSPPAFQKNIDTLFTERFASSLNDIFDQMIDQQKEVRQRLVNFSEVESEKQRLMALSQELKALKKKGSSDEVVRRQRQDVSKLAQRIHTKLRQYESSKGIILIQELYISSLEKSEHLVDLVAKQEEKAKKLKSMLKANHISASRDIEALTHNLGVHAHHLLVQHAIYAEVEADTTQVVTLENLGRYDSEQIKPILNLLPSVRDTIGDEEVTSNRVLHAVMESDLSQREVNAFQQFFNEHPEPSSGQVQRFTQQMDSFLDMKQRGGGVDSMAAFVGNEISVLRAVLRFAAEQNKLNTDFRNHLRYYEQLFITPFMDILEQSGHGEFEDLDRALGKIQNTMKVQMEIRYSSLEERALLAMFRHINSQMQNENLFAAKVFTRQIKAFMNQLAFFKSKIPVALIKKILATYTVYMMGSSRTKDLSRESTGAARQEIANIRQEHSSLTES